MYIEHLIADIHYIFSVVLDKSLLSHHNYIIDW